MRIIFSRKGFDSSAGRTPSPIVEGRPLSLPIPTSRRSTTSYGDLGLGDPVQATQGRISATDLCHHDPLFDEDRCCFGQCAAAQGHLEKQGVTVGDVVLFFGLFSDEEARAANHASPSLRLTRAEGPLNSWTIPPWLRTHGLTYHARPERWIGQTELDSAKRGQEFVSDVGDDPEALGWLDAIIAEIADDTNLPIRHHARWRHGAQPARHYPFARHLQASAPKNRADRGLGLGEPVFTA